MKISEVSKDVRSPEHKVFKVSFPKGARTKLHYHTGAQLLIVTKGRGSLEFFKKVGKGNNQFKIKFQKKKSLNQGDIAYIPAKTLHTHGSVTKNQVFSHVAINSYPSKNKPPKTIWYESDFKNKVTEILK